MDTSTLRVLRKLIEELTTLGRRDICAKDLCYIYPPESPLHTVPEKKHKKQQCTTNHVALKNWWLHMVPFFPKGYLRSFSVGVSPQSTIKNHPRFLIPLPLGASLAGGGWGIIGNSLEHSFFNHPPTWQKKTKRHKSQGFHLLHLWRLTAGT